MAQQSYSASAPGSLMLMGEHAVLARKQALVCAIDKRITVQLTPNASQIITISDATLGTLQFASNAIPDAANSAPFQFVLAALNLFAKQIKTGFDLAITAEFSSTVGFGSSAAVSVATIAVLAHWLHNTPVPPKKVFKLARQAVLQVQQVGSGADVAASVYGGVLIYKAWPLQFIPLPKIPALTAVYCGYKKPTKEVIELVQHNYNSQPKVFDSIFNGIQSCVTAAITAIQHSNWDALGKLFAQHHGLQAALGVSDATLDALAHNLTAQPAIYGAKISGSGLGDCVIGLGALASNIFPRDLTEQQQGLQQFNINVEQQGLTCANY